MTGRGLLCGAPQARCGDAATRRSWFGTAARWQIAAAPLQMPLRGLCACGAGGGLSRPHDEQEEGGLTLLLHLQQAR